MKSKAYRDPVVEFYMRGIDRTVLRENLKLTYEQRIQKHTRAVQMIEELRQSKKKTRKVRCCPC
jgi:uncharacterized Zn finger protein